MDLNDLLGSRSFKRNGIGVTAPVLSDGLATYTPSGEVRGGVKTTFHSALKNADIQTSSSGAVASSRVYDAFGNDLSVTGSWKSPFGYAGQFGYQQDVDTGLKLLGHRYYDSDTGRFLTRDPIMDGRNWYTYCGNDPLSYVDPEGGSRLRIFELFLGDNKVRGNALSEINAVRVRKRGGNVKVVGPGSRAKAKEIEKIAYPNKKHLHHPLKHPSQYKEDPQGHYQSRGASGDAFYGKMKMLYPGTAAMLE